MRIALIWYLQPRSLACLTAHKVSQTQHMQIKPPFPWNPPPPAVFPSSAHDSYIQPLLHIPPCHPWCRCLSFFHTPHLAVRKSCWNHSSMFRIWTCLTLSTASSPTQVIIISGLGQWFSNFAALWDYPRVLWRPTWPFRTNTQKRCPFHYRGLEFKSRKSRNTWSNRQIWPWNMEWNRAKTNRVLPRKCTGHSKHPRPTTQEKTLHMDITRWSTPKSDWLYSLQPKMDKLYIVSKNKTGSWLWLRSWTPYCQIQT